MSDVLNPSNPNFLSPIGFQFQINRAPHITFFCQTATLPGVQLIDSQGVETPFVRMNEPGTKLEFQDVSFSFKVDEDMVNYLEIFNWLISMGFPESFDQATAFQEANQSQGTGRFSDGTLTILTSAHTPNLEVTFRDMYPLGLSNIDFDTKVSDVDHAEAVASFSYRDFVIQKL